MALRGSGSSARQDAQNAQESLHVRLSNQDCWWLTPHDRQDSRRRPFGYLSRHARCRSWWLLLRRRVYDWSTPRILLPITYLTRRESSGHFLKRYALKRESSRAESFGRKMRSLACPIPQRSTGTRSIRRAEGAAVVP